MITRDKIKYLPCYYKALVVVDTVADTAADFDVEVLVLTAAHLPVVSYLVVAWDRSYDWRF